MCSPAGFPLLHQRRACALFSRGAHSTVTMKKNTKAVTKSQSNPSILAELAEQINTTYAESQELACSAKKQAQHAIEVAIACGAALNKAKKEAGKKGFPAWIAKNCPGIKERTAYNYMKLARLQYIAMAKKPKSIRQAYISIGMLPAIPPTPRRKQLAAPAVPVIDVEAVSSPATSEPAPAQKPAPAVATTPAEAQAALRAVQERQAAEQKPEPAPLTESSVREWLNKTKEGRSLMASLTPTPMPESGRFLKIAVGPPMTLALMKSALKSLIALIPMDADHKKFADCISECAASELRLARPVRNYSSAYTSA